MHAVIMTGGFEEPVINLLAEAPNKEVADNLIQEYSNRIRELMK